jgi:hypothetical protein
MGFQEASIASHAVNARQRVISSKVPAYAEDHSILVIEWRIPVREQVSGATPSRPIDQSIDQTVYERLGFLHAPAQTLVSSLRVWDRGLTGLPSDDGIDVT